jgi:hypothetical protein
MSKDWLHSVNMPLAWCPTCKSEHDAATSVSHVHARPQPGDFSLCINCGQICRFTAGLQLAASSAAEVEQLRRSGNLSARQVEQLRFGSDLLRARQAKRN